VLDADISERPAAFCCCFCRFSLKLAYLRQQKEKRRERGNWVELREEDDGGVGGWQQRL